ncbi:uncharacterized protein [Anabrus simplex]|uniref:uncharacterized protein n=1 Tax=Anabrus simplex TaxID=316456 RepID=UPI0035A386EA
MSDVRNCSKQFIAEFIELYKSLPSLWKLKSKEYYDRNKKNAAYDKMIDKLKEIEPSADRASVTKKVNSLRSSYRKEKKKVKDSLKAGSNTEDVYVPTLWYYNLLEFVDDQDTPRIPISNVEETIFEDESDTASERNNSTPEPRPPSQSSASSSVPDRRPSDVGVLPPTPSTRTPPRQLKRKRKTEVDSILTCIGKQLTERRAEDRHDIYGRNIAHKLRHLPNDQRIYVEKIINEAIFEAELGNLNRNCCVHLPTRQMP